jgi:YVTN family beta-propeller protein
VNTSLASSTGTVSVIATATDQVIGTVPVGPGPIDVAFSPDGRTAYVTDNGVISPGSVSVIDTATLAVVATLNPTMPSTPATAGANPTSVAVTPDGKEVWVSAVDDLQASSPSPDLVSVFDATTGAQLATIPVGTGPFFLALSPDGRDAYVADKLSCDVRQIDTTTFTVVATVRWPTSHGCPFGLALGPSDTIVYTVTGSDQTFDQAHPGRAFGSVDFATGRAQVESTVGSDAVTVALSADGTTAYVVDADRPVLDLVDPLTGSIRATFALPSGGVS